MRKEELRTEGYYHIYNRGVDKREVFLDAKDYARFLIGMREFNRIEPIGSLYEKSFRDKRLGTKFPIGDLVHNLVDIVAYCLNPNHFHLILKQNQEKGISKFMLKISTGYTTYFNKKYSRSGSLFQGPFKSIHISSNEYLLYLSAYANCNSQIHGIEKAENWKWSSFLDYIGKRNGTLCRKEVILNDFKDGEDYKKFALANAEMMSENKKMGKLILEE